MGFDVETEFDAKSSPLIGRAEGDAILERWWASPKWTAPALTDYTNEVKCVICGHIFVAKRTNAKYCSDACRKEGARRRRAGVRQEPAETKSNDVVPRPKRQAKAGVEDDRGIKKDTRKVRTERTTTRKESSKLLASIKARGVEVKAIGINYGTEGIFVTYYVPETEGAE